MLLNDDVEHRSCCASLTGHQRNYFPVSVQHFPIPATCSRLFLSYFLAILRHSNIFTSISQLFCTFFQFSSGDFTTFSTLLAILNHILSSHLFLTILSAIIKLFSACFSSLGLFLPIFKQFSAYFPPTFQLFCNDIQLFCSNIFNYF